METAPSPVLHRGEGFPPLTLANAAQGAGGVFSSKGTMLAYLQPTRTHRSFPAGLLPNWVPPVHAGAWSCSSSVVGLCISPLWTSLRLLSAHSYSLSRSSGWQHHPLALLVLCPLQTCWVESEVNFCFLYFLFFFLVSHKAFSDVDLKKITLFIHTDSCFFSIEDSR